MAATSGWSSSAWPTIAPSPMTRLMTPAGAPRRCRLSTRAQAAEAFLPLQDLGRRLAQDGVPLQGRTARPVREGGCGSSDSGLDVLAVTPGVKPDHLIHI